MLPQFFSRPEYLFRPSALGRRLQRQFEKGNAVEEVMLPWGAPILIESAELIGSNLWKVGIYDLIVAESLMRLADSGEYCLDVGANIGLMTSALAYAVGTVGHVVSFEPSPGVIPKLEQNVELWRTRLGWRQVTVEAVALSRSNGEAILTVPFESENSPGIASMEPDRAGESVTVPTRTLDSIQPEDTTVGVMKIDVEGHELGVLSGATDLLSSGRIRDIVFEGYGGYPSPVTRLLASYGYSVFGLRKGLLAPRLAPDAPAKISFRGGETPNYLATRDASRAVQRLAPMGWQALRTR